MRSCVDRRLRLRSRASFCLSSILHEREQRESEREYYIGHVARRFGERYVECTVDFLTVRLFVIVRARAHAIDILYV